IRFRLMTKAKHVSDLVTVASFDSEPEALKLKSWLEAGHVPAEIQDETRLQRYWVMVTPRAGIHGQTRKAAFDSAKALLLGSEAGPFLTGAITCPSCGSLRAQYPDLTRKNMIPALAGRLLMLLHFKEPNYYCEDCHFTWLNDTREAQLQRQ